MKWLTVCGLLMCAALVGCGSVVYESKSGDVSEHAITDGLAKADAGKADAAKSDAERGAYSRVSSQQAILDASRSMLLAAAGVTPGAPKAGDAFERKIIYNVELDIVVRDFSGVQDKIESFVKQHREAYIAATTITGATGSRRSGQWKVLVQHDKADDFLRQVRGLGEVSRERKTSEEVSDEFYDITSRLKNKQTTEKRLIKMIEERTGELDHVRAVEKDLSEVREEIERMQGRLQRLDHLTRLTTIAMNIEEIREYTPDGAIDFWARVQSAVGASWRNVREFGQNTVLFAIFALPWLPLLIVVFLALRYAWRRFPGRRAKAAGAR